jgi:hypothetical protein
MCQILEINHLPLKNKKSLSALQISLVWPSSLGTDGIVGAWVAMEKTKLFLEFSMFTEATAIPLALMGLGEHEKK